MAKITINITDDIVDALAYEHGYRDTMPVPGKPNETRPNPETKAQFARKVLKNLILGAAKRHEIKKAEEVARVAKEAELADLDIDVS